MKSVILLTGPTASGKSALAVEYAVQAGNIAIINADSMQVYREIGIVSAAPSAKDLQKAEHRLYTFLPGSEQLSVAKWLELIEKEVKNVHLQGKIPLIVGGSAMYIRILLDGISNIPEIPDEISNEVENMLKNLGNDDFFAELARLDENAAKMIKKTDKQRMLRAFSVKKHTGKSIFDFYQNPKQKSALSDYSLAKILLIPDRNVVYNACNSRFCDMLQNGALEEGKSLIEYGYSRDLSVHKAIGVPQIIDYLEGRISHAEMVNNAQKCTRNYAKRQLTWFRNKFTDFHAISEKNLDKFVDIIQNSVQI